MENIQRKLPKYVTKSFPIVHIQLEQCLGFYNCIRIFLEDEMYFINMNISLQEYYMRIKKKMDIIVYSVYFLLLILFDRIIYNYQEKIKPIKFVELH